MSDLEEYRSQLRDVEENLQLDPNNDSLKELQNELQNLVDLLSQEEDPQEHSQKKSEDAVKVVVSHDSSDNNSKFTIGESVFAKPKLENSYKEGKIVSISGNHKLVTVEFVESKTTDSYPIEEIHRDKPKSNALKYKKQAQKKNQTAAKEEKYEKELNESTQSWKKFNKKSKIKSSQFRTVDSINSKVGVVNSGKSMTSSKTKEKNLHRFNPY